MKWLKKFLLVLYILLLLGGMVYTISNDAFLSVIRSLSSSDTGILVTAASYFKYADTWNYIFLILFFAISLSLFMGINLVINKVMSRIANKSSKLTFLNSEVADYTIQYPLSIFILALVFLVATNTYVPYIAKKNTVSSIQEITHPMPAFVLGTSKMLTSGKGENVYYRQRINAAMELYRANKVTYFILSGDGGMERSDGYNETRDMRNDLLTEGVPEDKIKIDTAGFRTLDSMLRLRALFKLNDIIIVSQAFHTPRALVLGKFYGLDAVAYNSKGEATSSMLLREFGSRPRMIMDLIFFNMQPKVTNSEGVALEYREAFEAKSDLHVLILISTFLLAFVMVMGYGVYQSHTGEARKRAAKKYSLIGASITVVLIVMVSSVYKNLDIKFIDEVVETVAKIVDVKTAKMEVKEVQKEKVIERIRNDEAIKVVPVAVSKPVITEKPKPEFNTAEVVALPTPEKNVQQASVEMKKSDDLFNTAQGDDDLFNTNDNEDSSSPIKRNSHFFNAIVHKGQAVTHDGVITLRLTEPITIHGKTFPAKYIFDGKTIVYDNRLVIVADLNSEIRNFEDGKEGMVIKKRHLLKKGEVVLAEGESIGFAY